LESNPPFLYEIRIKPSSIKNQSEKLGINTKFVCLNPVETLGFSGFTTAKGTIGDVWEEEGFRWVYGS
jgi:hypothetical protein